MTHLRFPNPHAFDMALQPAVFAMMRRGIRIDEKMRDRLSEEKHTEWNELQHKLNQTAGRDLNVNSPKQMKEWLYGDLNLPTRRHRGSITTKEDALRALMAQCEDKVYTLKTAKGRERWLRGYVSIRLTLQIRGVRKALSSYLDVDIDTDSRMRSTIAVGGTETGRFSHSKTLWGTGCNLATVPRGLRTMFIADDGFEIAELDLNRGESWVYSFLSLDPELIRIHTTGADFHAETASAISTAFEDEPLDYDWIVKHKNDEAYKIRYLGKKVNHASSYRMGAFRGAEVINEEADDTGITTTVAQMKEAQRLWNQKYMGIERWWGGIDEELESSRRLETPFGRIRIFYGWMDNHLKKEATAYVPQSTSVDFLNLGMLDVYNDLDEDNGGILQLLHQNHDSILIQYPESRREEVLGEVQSRIEANEVIINDNKITIPTEVEYGQNWGTYDEEENPTGLREWD